MPCRLRDRGFGLIKVFFPHTKQTADIAAISEMKFHFGWKQAESPVRSSRKA